MIHAIIMYLTASRVIGTSALAQYEINGAVEMYSGILQSFMIWDKYNHRICPLLSISIPIVANVIKLYTRAGTLVIEPATEARVGYIQYLVVYFPTGWYAVRKRFVYQRVVM